MDLLKHTGALVEREGDVVTLLIDPIFKPLEKRLLDSREELCLRLEARKLRLKFRKPTAESKLKPSLALAVEVIGPMRILTAGLTNNDTMIALDFETDSVDALTNNIIGCGITTPSNMNTYYMPIAHTDAIENNPLEALTFVLKRLGEQGKTFVVHNLAFEGKILNRLGVKAKLIDTMILGYIEDSSKMKGLKDTISRKYSIRMPTYEDLTVFGKGRGKTTRPFADVPVIEAAQYCGSDTFWTATLLNSYMSKNMLSEQLVALDHRVALACSQMESEGVLIDTPRLIEFTLRLEALRDKIVSKMYELAGCEFNLASPKQLAHLIYDTLGVVPDAKCLTKTKAYSTNEGTINYLVSRGEKIPLLQLLLKWREYQKLITTYCNPILEKTLDGDRLHARFNYVGTETGRLSSSEINMQNIPAQGVGKEIRSCIIPEDGYVIMTADYSQIELRVLAHMMSDKQIIELFNQGYDMHSATAAAIMDIPIDEVDEATRRIGKCISEDSWIFYNDEYIRIGNLSHGREADTYYPISGSVLTEKNILSNVDSFYCNGTEKTYTVITNRGVLKTSGRHLFEYADGTLGRADSLQAGQLLSDTVKGMQSLKPVESLPFNPHIKNLISNKHYSMNITSDLAYFAGVFLGDGTSNHNSCGITAGAGGKYTEWVANVVQSARVCGIEPSVKVSARGVSNIYLGSTHTVNILKQLGLVDISTGKKNMKVPEWVMNGCQDIRISFVAGLMDTDGTVSVRGSADMTTKDVNFAGEVCTLLSTENYGCGLEVTYNKTYQRDYYRVRLYKAWNNLLKSYMHCSWKLDRLSPLINAQPTYKRRHKVIKVVEDREPSMLVDISVTSSEHMYIANCMRVHNTLNFALIYGQGPSATARQLKISVKEAQELIEKYFLRFPVVKQLIDDTISNCRRFGYVSTLLGRKRWLPKINSSDWQHRGGAERQTFNHVIQGTAADVVRCAMIRVHEELLPKYQDKVKMIMQVHDEIVLEVHESVVDSFKVDLAQVMESPFVIDGKTILELGVPLKVDMGVAENYGGAK